MSIWHESRGTGDHLVLLHGWGMNSAVWEPVIDALQQHFCVTRIDLPGHGFSDEALPDHASLDEWIDVIEPLLPDNTILLGWSLGGLVAMQLALTHPGKISRLILMTATPSFMQRADWPCAMAKDTLENFATNLKDNLKSTLNRFLSLQIKGCDNARELLKQLKTAFAARPCASQQALATGLHFLQDSDIRPQLVNLRIPSLWLFGEKDSLVPACAAGAIINYQPGASVNVLQGAGHVPFLSHMNESMQIICNWVKADEH